MCKPFCNKYLEIIICLLTVVSLSSCNRNSTHEHVYFKDDIVKMPSYTDKVEKSESVNSAQKGDKPVNNRENKIKGHDELNTVLSPTQITKHEVYLVRNAYLLSYNIETRCPNYVSWKLWDGRLEKNVERTDWFEEDSDVAEDYRIKHTDYSRSGYDRGHMCPAADNRYDSTAMQECFLMTNMCPQTHKLNAGDWNDLEDLCRKWAQAGIEVHVVCGPIFSSDNSTDTIGKRKRHKIKVPDKFFKVILLRDGDDICGMGFVMPNDNQSRELTEYLVSIDEVEKLTKYDFFHNLPDNTERIVEMSNSMYN